METEKNLAVYLLGRPMCQNHYDRLESAWRHGQFLPLAGGNDPVECMDAFIKGLSAVSVFDEEFKPFPILDGQGLFSHLLAGVDRSRVNKDLARQWVQFAGKAMQPAITRVLLDHLDHAWGPDNAWVIEIASYIHPQAPEVMQALVDHGFASVQASTEALLAARTTATAQVLINAGVDPLACNLAAAWASAAEDNPEGFDRDELPGMIALALQGGSPAQKLVDLVPFAPALGTQSFKRQIKAGGMDPAALLPDGRSLVEHLCLSGMRRLFGYVGTSPTWEQRAIGQAKMINWAMSCLPSEHPRHAHSRAACLLAYATMQACLGRNYGALVDSTDVTKLGMRAGHAGMPEPAPLVHDWLVQAVQDGLLDNGSTIAASLLRVLPVKNKLWLEDQCLHAPETAAMGFMRCAGRYQWDDRWQTASATRRLVAPQYDLLSIHRDLFKDNPSLLGSASPLLVLASMICVVTKPASSVNTNNNRDKCVEMLNEDPSLMRLDVSDPDLEPFMAFARHAFGATPAMAGVLASAEASSMNRNVKQVPSTPPASAPRL